METNVLSLVEVRWSDRLGESKLASKDRRNADFVRFDVDVRRNNRTSGIVDTFSLADRKDETVKRPSGCQRQSYHHILAEQAFFLFKQLFHTGWRKFSLSDNLRVLAAVNEAIHVRLQLD